MSKHHQVYPELENRYTASSVRLTIAKGCRNWREICLLWVYSYDMVPPLAALVVVSLCDRLSASFQYDLESSQGGLLTMGICRIVVYKSELTIDSEPYN